MEELGKQEEKNIPQKELSTENKEFLSREDAIKNLIEKDGFTPEEAERAVQEIESMIELIEAGATEKEAILGVRMAYPYEQMAKLKKHREDIKGLMESEGLTEIQAIDALNHLPRFEVSGSETLDFEKLSAEFVELIVQFANRHPIQELYAITDLTPEEAEKNEAREAAKKDLIPIVEKLNVLKEASETGQIAPEKYEEFRSRYKYLSRAVGMINGGKVDHER